MSHRFDYDLSALKSAVDQKADFIGLLGPLSRATLLYEKYQEKYGEVVSEEIKKKIRTPIGIEKLAYDEEGVALSIIAQLKKEVYSIGAKL